MRARAPFFAALEERALAALEEDCDRQAWQDSLRSLELPPPEVPVIGPDDPPDPPAFWSAWWEEREICLATKALLRPEEGCWLIDPELISGRPRRRR